MLPLHGAARQRKKITFKIKKKWFLDSTQYQYVFHHTDTSLYLLSLALALSIHNKLYMSSFVAFALSIHNKQQYQGCSFTCQPEP
jgi:hypothetical protein